MIVRFAPSPTGPLHIGGARSALFNYLLARKENGKFIVRIEDTDLERSKREYEEEIVRSLNWLGIDWDEGLGVGGDHGPYRQTERLDIYDQYVNTLLENGQAYYCFCSDEDLEAERAEMIKADGIVKYSGKCSHLTPEEVSERLARGEKPGVRLRVPLGQTIVVNDLIRGQVSFNSDTMGDFIIRKADGIPVYNYAVVIDDVLMDVTLVMRAEEHLSNTPRQLAIYDALNLPRPEFAHVSLILGSDRQKMSKRHGATSVMQYRERGYLPQAVFNFLALLGWTPEGELEIMTKEEIIAAFSVDRVAKSPAVFDVDKLNYINQQHMKRLSHTELLAELQPFIVAAPEAEKFAVLTAQQMDLLIEALRDRLVCLVDFIEEAKVFLAAPEMDLEVKEVLAEADSIANLRLLQTVLPELTGPTEIKSFLKQFIKNNNLAAKSVYMPIRVALTGKMHGPDLPYLLSFLGREEVLHRIEQAVTGC